jgi:LysM repeat protein
MKIFMRKILFLVPFLAFSMCLLAEELNPVYVQYIEQYRDLAIEQQRKHKVPAAITMAQGLLESAAGQSELATKANNHFGIKCADWNGKKVYKDDDTKNECFRSYPEVSYSYEDHSLFLQRKRYQSLFALPLADYKSWAHGLKACGYATDPKYADKLIHLIELYNLQDLTLDPDLKAGGFVSDADTTWQNQKANNTIMHNASDSVSTQAGEEDEVIVNAVQGGISNYVYPPMEDLELYNDHPSGYRNGVRYIIAAQGETFASLAHYLNMREKTLRKYNDALDERDLEPGDMVYVYPKKNKTTRKYTYYYFRPGDTAWHIAQKYGIKLNSLYKLNGIPFGTPLTTQQRLKLR